MGTRGPVPKRTEAKAGHRTKAEMASVDQAPAGADLDWGNSEAEWAEMAAGWYESLQVSGQALFFEQSDVMLARYVATMMSRSLRGNPNAKLVAAVLAGMTELLSSEASRRRMKLELTREPAQVPASVAVMDKYRNALGG